MRRLLVLSFLLTTTSTNIGGSLAFSPSTFTSTLTKSSILQNGPKRSSPFLASPPPSSSSSSSSSLSLKRKLLSEDDLAEPPNQKVIETIESLSKSSGSSPGTQSIIASDVAAQSGLSLSEAQKSLSALASLTRGDISVTTDGELLYTFPQNIQSVLSSNSLRYKITSVWRKDVWPKLFWGIRISFGVFLFISIAAIFSTLIFVQSGGGDDREDNDRRGNGGGFGFRYGVGDLLFDLFYPRPYLYSSNYYGYYGRYDPYYLEPQTDDNNGKGGNNAEEEERTGIFEGIFSYIFGDGNPNRNLEAARLREASRTIRANGGAVTAEQLAPFCDVEDPDNIMREDFSLTDESFVLPIVSQLGGVPTVTDEGDIIYLFPDLQISAMDDRGGDRGVDCLQEMTLEFNRNGDFGNIAAAALGVVNLGGALYLGQILASPTLTGVQLAGFFGAVQAGYPLLLIYALLFNVIPAARYVINQRTNAEISKRNSARRKWLTYLQVGGTKVTRKLSAAKSLRRKMKRLVGEKGVDTAYDTRTSIEDLTAQKQAEEMKKFDELLGGSGDQENNNNTFQ